MGLFGGFKAKFKGSSSRERTPKATKADKNNVVCVKYKVFSEFDSESANVSSTSQPNIGKSDVVRQRKVAPKPQVKNVFETTNKINGDVKHVEPEVAPAFKKMAPKVTSSDSNNNSVKKNEVLKKEAPKPNEKKVAQAEIPMSVEIKQNKLNSPQSKNEASHGAIKKTAPLPEKPKKEAPQPKIEEDIYTELPSFSGINLNHESADDENIYQSFNDDEDDGNFKIHIANHNSRLFDEESSEGEDLAEIKFSPVNYSSQAASIFFGDENEPEIMRPRNIVMNDDDNSSNGSSADC